VTTEEDRVKFTEQLSEAEDWLYGDGEEADTAAFQDKLKALETVGKPIALRASEAELRPEVCVLAQWVLSRESAEGCVDTPQSLSAESCVLGVVGGGGAWEWVW
jgi:hypoxia up-regulated 1